MAMIYDGESNLMINLRPYHNAKKKNSLYIYTDIEPTVTYKYITQLST